MTYLLEIPDCYVEPFESATLDVSIYVNKGKVTSVGGLPVKEFNGPTEENKWIPVTDRLPNSNGCYLVWRPHFFGGEVGMPSICYFDGQDTWHDSFGVDFNRVLSSGDVVAWMSLPEPYKEGVEE